jgi:hypothetical protein
VFEGAEAYGGCGFRGDMDERDVRNAFWRNEDGSWICIDPITIEHPKGRVQVAPGTTLMPGTPYMGIDLAAWLEQQQPSQTQT